MIQTGANATSGSAPGTPAERRRRRFPYLTGEDKKLLEQLDALAPERAGEFEASLQRDHRARAGDCLTTAVLECELGAPLEVLDDTARWSTGAGGGRRRPTHGGAE